MADGHRLQSGASTSLSNAEIADRLASLAQLLSSQKENPYKVKAYQRAAARIRTFSESLGDLVQDEADLTSYAGIGEGIAAAIREIVQTGTLRKLETLRAQASPAPASISQYPRLDPRRVLRVYKKLGISSAKELRERLDSGELERALGLRMAQHVRQGLAETQAMLLYRADDLRVAVEEFLVGPCGVRRAELAGEVRRRVEIIEELTFVIETHDFASVVRRMQRCGGRTDLVSTGSSNALFALPAGVLLRLELAGKDDWGLRMIACTGSTPHLKKLASVTGALGNLKGTPYPTEETFYETFGLQFLEPELREGRDEVERAAQNDLPTLVTASDMRGELHAHSTASDGSASIEDMAEAARERGYEYIGITDHSQSLKIARGISVDDLWAQIRYIEKLDARLRGFRILKSAEVDILADGSLDYPDELLRELDYTVCSIHSRFDLDRRQQTERLLGAMDNRYFNILGHATGRLLLKRPGYEIDTDRVIEQARRNGCFFEINSSPDRLDLSAENACLASAAGVLIAINTDAHGIRELPLIRCGIDQARRAGLAKYAVLNCLPWKKLAPLFRL
ncbi:MAG TPA: PHP domain-containing protein [Bryobacteraceae bacterium]